jgi:hypothetical protein
MYTSKKQKKTVYMYDRMMNESYTYALKAINSAK